MTIQSQAGSCDGEGTLADSATPKDPGAHAAVFRHSARRPAPGQSAAAGRDCRGADLKARVEQATQKNSNSAVTRTILLVDDGDALRVTTMELLCSLGFTVDAARSGEEALALFDPHTHDAVVTDNAMPGISGAEMAHVIKLRSRSTPILMYTANPPEDRSCVDLVIQKPAPVMELKQGVEKLLAR